MGNQGTATEAFRRAVELIQAGSIGAIKEIHVWDGGGSGRAGRPRGSEPVPEGLDWDLWLGPAAERPSTASGSSGTRGGILPRAMRATGARIAATCRSRR